MLLSIILFIVLGGVAGWLASIVMGTSARMGLGANVIIGCVGALVGGMLFNAVGAAGLTGFNLWSLLVAIIGAAGLLALARLVR